MLSVEPASTKEVYNYPEHRYDELERIIKSRLTAGEILFRTSVEPDALWTVYLNNLEEETRQHYNCRCCRNFIERYGDLCTIGEDGLQVSIFWHDAVPDHFESARKALQRLVEGSTITGVFLSEEEALGVAESKRGWTHLNATNPSVFRNKLLTSFQKEAELKEDFKTLMNTFGKFDIENIEVALQVLKSETLPSYVKGLGVVEWYHKVRVDSKAIKNSRVRTAFMWKVVASAPPGYCHIKNTVVGTLIEDIEQGMEYESIKRRWAEKVHPLQYQRPQAAPSDNQIKVAEETVEKLGIARSLKRRYAFLHEVRGKLWEESAGKLPESDGVFSHLKNQKLKSVIVIEGGNMTWVKFARDVLPTATSIEVLVPHLGNFIGVTNAEDAEAPPILQWDNEGDRYPLAHYLYHNGSYASNWGVQTGWTKCPCVFKAPHGNVHAHHTKFIVFALPGANDSRSKTCGRGLFPETMKTELRAIRSVIEAHSKSGGISGTGDANGLMFSNTSPIKVKVNGSQVINIDRWE